MFYKKNVIDKMNQKTINWHKKIEHIDYFKWMKFILRRSEEVGKVELPITAVIIDENGRCIGRGSNKREINNDPLGHAELIALRQASWIKNDWRFNECSIIVNLEPCTMCAAALVQARMGQVIYGTEDDKRGGFGGTIDLSKHESAHHKMKVVGGILNQDCKNKIKLWFKKMRNQK
jgi:tRNA(adenine34) deaminase